MNTLYSQTQARRSGFTLTELLVVIAIVASLAGLSMPVLKALNGAGSINHAASQLLGSLEAARAFAMAENTYVRVAFARVNDGRDMLLVTLFDSSGSLEPATGSGLPSGADVADPSRWPLVSKPILLRGVAWNTLFGAANEPTPFDRDPVRLPDITGRRFAGYSTPEFDAVIEFTPVGSVRLDNQPARVIRIPMDASRTAEQGRNPFVIRLFGTTGSTQLLRKEHLGL